MIEPRVHEFPGGIYSADGEIRTDINVGEQNPLNEDPYPVALDIQIVTGQGVFNLCELSPTQVAELGKWLMDVAQESIDAYKQLGSN